MSTVVPIGGNVTSALLLGRAWAVCLADEPEDFGLALAVERAEDDEADVDGPETEADDEAVLCTALPAAELELDDPHPASSSSSEPTPPATAHPLLRIRLSPKSGPAPGREGFGRNGQPVVETLLAESLITCHFPSRPLPLVLNAPAPFKVYRG